MNNAIARLLATENLTIKTGNLKTAYFDTKNRVLGLPDWSSENPSVFNLLVGHEVGHALFTPHLEEGKLFKKMKALPHSYVNITEDNRIERMIQNEYPGLAYHFNKGYDNLLQREFFGDISNTAKLKLIDKVNLISKLGNRIAITLTDEELHLYNQTNVAMTFEAAVEAAEAILAYDRENPPEQNENEEATTDKGEDCGDSDVGDEDAGESDADSKPDDTEDSKSGDTQTGDGGEETNAEAPAAEDGEEEAADEEASTDEAFQKKMEGLVENEEGELDTFSINQVRDADIAAVVTTYAQYDAMYDNFANSKVAESEEKVTARLREIKRAVQPAVKAFEQNKAAESWKHAQTSNTGRINVNKLHSYKIDDDIFLRTTRRADAKSHGMFIMLDLSQSMHSSLGKVIDQALHSVLFCKAVGIPFDVYTFTSATNQPKLRQTEIDSLAFGDLATIRTANVVQRTSSTLNRTQFERSLIQLSMLAPTSRNYYRNGPIVPIDAMRGTPLIETLIVTATLLAKFKAQHRIEKPSFVFITDGDGFSPKVWTDTFENRPVTKGLRRHPWDKQNRDNSFAISSVRYESDAFLNFTILGKVIKTRSHCQSSVQADLLQGIMKMLNVKCVGFYIAYKLKEGINTIVDSTIVAETGQRRYRYAQEEHAFSPTDKFMKQAKKDNLATFTKTLGYDVLYVMPVDKANDEKTLEGTTSATALKDFRAMAKSRNKNKILLTAFGKFIAQ